MEDIEPRVSGLPLYLALFLHYTFHPIAIGALGLYIDPRPMIITGILLIPLKLVPMWIHGADTDLDVSAHISVLATFVISVGNPYNVVILIPALLASLWSRAALGAHTVFMAFWGLGVAWVSHFLVIFIFG